MIESEAIINQVRHFLSGQADISLAILYGSAASDRLSRHSDVDLAVSSAQGLSAETCLSISLALTRKLDREVSVIDMNKMHGVILQEVLTKGIIVKKNSQLMVRHVLRMQEFTEDVLPYQKMAFEIQMGRYLT